MQIAGQDGTFSLVALPPVSSQTPQKPQQNPSIQKNLKLPIPRYQPLRSKVTSEKIRPPASASKGKRSFRITQTESLSVSSSKKKKKDPKSTKVPVVPKEEPPEQVLLIDPASSDISVTDSSEKASKSGVIQGLHYPINAAKTSPNKSVEEHSVHAGKINPDATQPASSITVLSPAIFSKTVQIIPSPPKGKLPILPLSRMKTTLVPAGKFNMSSDKNVFSNQVGLGKNSDTIAQPHQTAEVSQGHNPIPNPTIQPQAKAAILAVPGLPQKSIGKKRGRKRKTLDDIMAFEARKKRSLSFFRRRVPEKQPPVSPGSKPTKVDISKYRSIRPKPPLVIDSIPQLVSLPAVTSDGKEPELVLAQPHPTTTKEIGCCPSQGPVTIHLKPASHTRIYLGSRPIYRCPTCNRCFQFKHHLKSHMNSHTNSRPYICPVCRKAYAHSGSLSTHMKLHHSEVRPRQALSCEFCVKSFGYVGVYFSHLREVHKVVLTVEPSISHHEDHVSVEGANSSETSDEQDCEDPVELQIKCGRCQAVTPTFADMKMHLLYVHGEEVKLKPDDSPLSRCGRKAEDELVKHAAHYWRQLNEKRNLVKCGSCDEEFFSFSKLRRHIVFHHRGGDDSAGVLQDGVGGLLSAGSAFNCVLCSTVLDTKEGIFEHWKSRHHCEQPSLLWAALSSFSGHDDED